MIQLVCSVLAILITVAANPLEHDGSILLQHLTTKHVRASSENFENVNPGFWNFSVDDRDWNAVDCSHGSPVVSMAECEEAAKYLQEELKETRVPGGCSQGSNGNVFWNSDSGTAKPWRRPVCKKWPDFKNYYTVGQFQEVHCLRGSLVESKSECEEAARYFGVHLKASGTMAGCSQDSSGAVFWTDGQVLQTAWRRPICKIDDIDLDFKYHYYVNSDDESKRYFQEEDATERQPCFESGRLSLPCSHCGQGLLHGMKDKYEAWACHTKCQDGLLISADELTCKLMCYSQPDCAYIAHSNDFACRAYDNHGCPSGSNIFHRKRWP